MTSETPDERSEGGVSENASGEHETRPEGASRNGERGAERPASDVTREQEVSENTNHERAELRADGGEPDDDGDDIPLDIAGHERRERPDDEAGMDAVLPDDVDAEEDDDEVEPVELLVQLAEDGRIDPWDIDVVRVTEEFLDALDDGDLRASGRALFYASVLVRMKGDDLLTEDEPEDDEPEPWEVALEGGDAPAPDVDPIAALEDEMERRLERKHARGTPETLDELVRELREAERESRWKQHRTYDTSDSPSGYGRGTQTLDYRGADEFRADDEPTEGDVTGKTHEEDIEATIDDVRAALRTHYDNGRTEVLYEEVADAGGSRVRTFLAVLFLAHRGRIRLQQDDLFGDLWLQDPAAATDSGEVTAD
jgi:segregation and condensation protein A